MKFIPPFARRLEPGQNHPDHTIFDFDNITDFELRFVRAAYKSLAWCVLHPPIRSEEHTSELQSLTNLVCRLLLEKKKTKEQAGVVAQRGAALATAPLSTLPV